MILIQLLFLMFLFVIIGESLRFFLSYFLNFLRNIDLLQACIINVYLAGLVLYAIALMPFQLFTTATSWGITITGGVFSIFLHRNSLKKMKDLLMDNRKQQSIYAFFIENKVIILKGVTVFGMFLLSLWIQVIPLSNFVFGSIHDTSLHALFVEIILENGHIPATHEPYLPAAIIYPQGAQVIFAYSCHILSILPPIAVFYISPLFSAMTTLAAYYLGKELDPTKHLDIIFAFIMSFVSMWPTYITWGSNPFIVGFPYFLICLSFIPFLYNHLSNSKINKLIVIGILYGYLASLHFAFYEVLVVLAFLWGVMKAFSTPKSLRKISNLLVACIFSLLPIIPFFYRFVKYYPYPGHNIGLPDDIVRDVTSPPSPRGQPNQSPIVSILMKFPDWLILNYNVHPDFILRVVLISLIFIALSAFFYSLKEKRKFLTLEKIAIIGFTAGILLNFSTYVFPIILWSRIGFIMYIFACILISTFTLRFCHVIRAFSARVLDKIIKKKDKAVIGSFMITTLTFSALYGPYVHHTILKKSETIQSLYGIYAITSESDLELMIWIRNNLPNNATILINPYESGGFIPSVSQRRVVFPFSAYLLSASYRKLISLIQQEVINLTTYKLLNKFGISHIFIGSKAVQQWGTTPSPENPKWDPLLFLGNPNFKLAKNIDDSYLFSISPNPNPNILFEENFEHLNLNQMGWKIKQIGRGDYNLTFDSQEDGNRFLRIETKKTSQWPHVLCLNRKVYLPCTSKVFLSFNLNASKIISPNTVSISIFNVDYSQYLSFVTPSLIYDQQPNIVLLQNFSGFFNFNLAELWMEKFNQSLPQQLIIEIALVNVDAKPSIVVIDDITLRHTLLEG